MKYDVKIRLSGTCSGTRSFSIDRRSNRNPSFRDLEEVMKTELLDNLTNYCGNIHLLPRPDEYNILFEEETSLDRPYTDNREIVYTASITLKNKKHATKLLSIMVDNIQRYFILPENTELGDYLPIPTGMHEGFCSYYRAKACDVAFEKSTGRDSGCGPKLYLQLRVEKITFRGQQTEDMSCNIYHNFKQRYGDKHVTERRLGGFRTSLENNDVWFWYHPTNQHPLKDDATAVEEWLDSCDTDTSTDRLIRAPEVRTSRTVVPSATTQPSSTGSQRSPGENPSTTSDSMMDAATNAHGRVKPNSNDQNEDEINRLTADVAHDLSLSEKSDRASAQ